MVCTDRPADSAGGTSYQAAPYSPSVIWVSSLPAPHCVVMLIIHPAGCCSLSATMSSLPPTCTCLPLPSCQHCCRHCCRWSSRLLPLPQQVCLVQEQQAAQQGGLDHITHTGRVPAGTYTARSIPLIPEQPQQTRGGSVFGFNFQGPILSLASLTSGIPGVSLQNMQQTG